jgi:hypothetical protein
LTRRARPDRAEPARREAKAFRWLAAIKIFGRTAWVIHVRSSAVEFAAGIPSRWRVTLQSGAVLDLAADAYSVADGFYLFDVLVDADEDEQAEMVVTWRVFKKPITVGVLVAKIPADEVASVETMPSWFDDRE